MISSRLRLSLLMLMLVTYVLVQSYAGRQDIRTSNLAACERGKLDRRANARGWRIAESARFRAHEYDISAEYSGIAAELELRARVVCERAFPKPSLIPQIP